MTISIIRAWYGSIIIVFSGNFKPHIRSVITILKCHMGIMCFKWVYHLLKFLFPQRDYKEARMLPKRKFSRQAAKRISFLTFTACIWLAKKRVKWQMLQKWKVGFPCWFSRMVGASRFERPTPCSQGRCANQAALRPDGQDYTRAKASCEAERHFGFLIFF